MSLRRTTILSIFITFLLLSVVLAISLQMVFSRHFKYEESQQNILNMQRVQSGFETNFIMLNYLADEWAFQAGSWDIPTESLETSNSIRLMEETFEKLNVDTWMVLSNSAEIFPVNGVENSENNSTSLLFAEIQKHPELMKFEAGVNRKSGILIVEQTPWLISLALIPGSEGGMLIIGHVVDELDMQNLSEQVKFPVRFGLNDAVSGDSDFMLAQDYFNTNNETIFSETLSDTNLAGYVLINDIIQQPALILRAEQYRFVSRNADLVMRSMLLALAAATLVFAALFFGLIERTMLSRLLRLEKEVQTIANLPESSSRVTVDQKDEIASVSANINQMLDSLEKSQQERYNELSALFEVSQLFLKQMGLPETRKAICELADRHFNMEYVWLAEKDAEDRMVPIASAGIELEKIEPVTIFDTTLHNYLLKPVFVINSLDLYGQLEEKKVFYAIVLPLNWGKQQQALYLFTENMPVMDEQEHQFLASFGSLSELVLSNTQLLAEVKTSQASLQELSRKLVKVNEEERRNLARELHDEIGQYLTALKLRLGSTARVTGQLDQSLLLVHELIQKVRKISLDLRPSVLDDLGLLPALEWYFERYTQQTGIVVDFDPQNLERQRFSSEIEITIFRIVQESLTNVARHAGVQNVFVRLETRPGEINLVIEDEGAGFALEGQKAGNSSGLTGMAERARLLQGEMLIQTQPGQGTCIQVRIPLQVEEGI